MEQVGGLWDPPVFTGITSQFRQPLRCVMWAYTTVIKQATEDAVTAAESIFERPRAGPNSINFMAHTQSYADVEDALIHAELPGTPPELHGFLTGMLSMDLATDQSQWLQDFFGETVSEIKAQEALCFRQLFEQTRQELADFDFSFELVLPDDDVALSIRARALGEWCHGYLTGIGYTGEGPDWPGECTEILRDFLEIVRLDDRSEDEADEAAYAELQEYVRVGVQVIRSEFHLQTPPQQH